MYPQSDNVTDMAYVLWNSSDRIGDLSGPILGAYSAYFIGFNDTASMLGWFTVLLTIVYFIKFLDVFWKTNTSNI